MEDNFNIIGEEVEQQEQQVPQQEEPPAKKLHKLLVDKKIYSKSFDEFNTQFSTPEKVAKLHTLLKEKNIYSKTDKEFNERFFPTVKKKGGTPAYVPPVPLGIASPSNPPLKSDGWGSNPLNPASVNFTKKPFPSTTGGMFNDIKEAVIKGKQEYERTGKPLPSFAKEKPKAKDISVKNQSSMGLIDPDDDIVSLSKEANRLEQKRDLMAEQSPESMISPMPGAWKMPTENKQSEEQSKVIRETVKSKGYDPDEVFNDYRDIPDEIAKQQGFRLEDKEFNPQMYYRKLGAAAWQSNLKNSLDVWEKTGDISSEDAAKVKELVYNSTIPGKTYSQRRQITADLSAALSSYIPDEEKRKRLLSNLATDRSISYGVLSPEDKQVIENSPEREYLDFDQTLGYQYLEDTDPEIAKGYKDLFVSDKAIDAEGNARAGWQFKASRLKTIGLQIQQSAVQEQINNLKNLFDQQNGELSPEQQAKYEELQLESERLKSESAQIPIKYPFPAQYNAVQNAQEILGSQLIEKGGVVGSPLWLLGKTSESIVNTGKGILDLAGEAVNGSESEASKVQRMAVLGEQKMLESIYQIPQKDQAMKSFEVVTSPEIKSQIDAIKNDKTLSYDDKLKKIVDIQIKNPGAISRLPIHNGKLDINPTTMFYAAGELASAIVPYIGLEAMTGGGATAGLARKFASSFNAAFLTGFRDAYAAAIDKGVANPYTYAIRNTAINSLAMAGAGTPQMIKQLAGTKSAIGQIINNMSNKSIQEMIDIGNKSISLFGKSIKTRPLVNAATAVGGKALEGMGGFTKFEAAMLPAKVINKKLNDEEINHEEMLKESVVMIATGGIVGLTGARERYKQLNDIDKGGYLKAAENPQAHIETAQKMLVDGLMTREDYDKAVSNIKLASEVSGRTKFVDNNGNELSQKKKADLLLLKMQEAELQKQTMGDVPDKLREKVRQETEELKSEMDKVYEPESSESTFESAKEGDVVIHQGKEVVVVSRGKSRGGTDIVTVKRLPKTKDEIKAQALQNVFNRVASEYKNLNPTWKDIEQNHPSEVRKEIEELTKLENSLGSSTYTIDLEQWNSEVKPKTGEGNKSEVPDTYIINGKPVSQQEFDTAIDNAKNTKETLDVEYNGDDPVRIQKIIDLGGTSQAGTTTITDEAETTTTVLEKEQVEVPENKSIDEVVVKEGFTEGKELNKMFTNLKGKYGDKKGSQIYEVANRLVNPNKNTIVEIRSNGVVVKEGGKYILKPFGNTDANSKNWTLYKGIDISDQFKEQPNATTSPTVEQSLKETPKAGSVGEVKGELPAQEKVKQLRQQEQAEYDAMPNPKDEAERKRIYDKYDKLISPLLDKGEVKAEVPKQKEGKYETKAKVIAEKIMAAKVVPDWLKIDDENISIKGSSAEDLKKVLADAVINMGKLLDKGVEFSQAVKESVKAMIDIHGEGKRKEIEEGFEKYYRENEAEVPPPSEPPVDKTKESDGKDDLSEKGILNRLNKAAGVPEQAKKGFEEAGLKYKVASREEAQSVAKSIIDEFGIDQAVLFADANKFKGGVSSAIYAESLNRLYEQEQNAKTPKEKADIASKFAEISLQYDETSREKGRDISYIDFFYKKSPLGIEIAENARRKKDFDKWSKNKEQSWKEVFEEMKKDPEFDEVFNEEVRERMKKERAESRKSRIEKVDKFFDDAIDKFSKGGATYSTVIPPQVITAALKGLKKAYHAGENIVEAVQQAIDYISTELKGTDWDKEKFRKEWEGKLADGTSKNKLTDEELKAKVLDKFRKKLKGLTESQKDEVIRQSHKSIIENGGLEFDEFKKIIARVTGRDEMTPEQSAKLKELVKDANSVDEAGKKARETRTSQSLKDYREAEKKAGKATRELSILLNSKPEILKRLTSIMQLNTLGLAALVNNPIYNVVNQVGIRLPVGAIKSGIDLGINKIGKLFGKDYKRETDIFSVGVQREFFKKLGLGGREAVGQFLTGLNRMDYIQKEVNSQQIRPITAILELKEYAQGNRNLTKAQIIDKALEATVGVPAEIVARALNLGDKPMRFAADAAQSAAFAKALGLKGIDYDMFMEFPREEAYRRYKEQGLSDAEASKKADYIKETIIKEGERSTFQQDNILNDVLGKIFGGDKSGTGALAKAVAVSPYIKIPSNAFWSYFNIVNPEVAFLQGLLYAGKAAAKQKGIYKRGLFDKENTSAAKDLNEAKYWIAHGVVGMATKAVIGSLVAAGIFRSSNDEDDTKKEREGEQYYEPQGTINMDKLWAYMKGEDPSKVKGGLTIQNRWFGHWGSVGNSIAKREEDMTPEQRENQKEVLTEMFDRMSASFLPELEQGIFGNSSSLVKAMASNDWKQWGVNTINMFTNIVHPATAAQLSKAQLPYYAKVKSDNFMTELKNSMLNRSSSLRKLTNEYPPSKIGIWGDEVKKKDDVLMRMFGISKTKDDNFAQPIYEDYKRTNNTKFFPSAVKPEVSSNGERVKLPADKALELEKYVGEQRRKLVAPYVNNMAFFEDDKGKRTYYKDLKTDEEKIKKLDIIYDEGFKRGKELFLQKPENKIYEIKEKSDNEKEKDKGEERSNKSLRKDLSEIN